MLGMSRAASISALDRILEPVGRCLTPDVARALAELRADPETEARIEELAERCSKGQLSPAEREEYETCVSAIDFLGALQAKARRILASGAA